MSAQDRPETPIQAEQPKRPKQYDTRIDDRVETCLSQLLYWRASSHDEYPHAYVLQQRAAWAERLMQAQADARAARDALVIVPPLALSSQDEQFTEWQQYLADKIGSTFSLTADELAASGDVNAAYAFSAKQQQQRAWRTLQPRITAAERSFITATSTAETDDPKPPHEA